MLLAVVMAVTIGWSATGPQQTSAGVASQPARIKIGLLAPLSGVASDEGRDMLHGATLAVEQIDEGGGIFVRERGGSVPVDLVVADDGTSIEIGTAAATRLVAEERVDVVTGGYSSAVTLAAQVVVAQHQVPFVIGGASTPRVTRRTDIDTSWMFHYLEIGPYRGKAISSYLATVVQPKVAPGRKLRVALVYQDSAFGEDFRLGLPGLGIMGWAESQQLPLEFVAVERFPLGETDFRPQLGRVKDTEPDVVIPMGFEDETISMMTQGKRDLGIRSLWGPVCSCVETPNYYRQIGEEGAFSTVEATFSTYETPGLLAGPLLAAFRSAYQQRWGEQPGQFAALQYDSMFVVKRAVEEAGSLEKARIRDALVRLDMPSLTMPVEGGRIRFDGNREVRFQPFITQLLLDPSVGEVRPRIVWPQELATAAFQLPPLRVLIVHSYDPGFQWTRDLATGIEEGLRRVGFADGRNAELRTFYMDTKVTYTTPEQIAERAAIALGLVDELQPDIVFLTDDPALKEVGVEYTRQHPEKELPFIFAGTNLDPTVYEPIRSLEWPGGRLTGALERLPYHEAFALAKRIVPSASRIVLLAESSDSTSFVRSRFGEEYLDHVVDAPLEVVDFLQIKTFAEWKQTILDYQSRVDIIGILNYHQLMDENGDVVPGGDVAAWTVQNNRLPELALVPAWAEDGLLLGMGNSGTRNGIYVGVLGGEVLRGLDPGTVPIVDLNFTEFTVNIDRAAMLGITIPPEELVNAAEVFHFSNRNAAESLVE